VLWDAKLPVKAPDGSIQLAEFRWNKPKPLCAHLSTASAAPIVLSSTLSLGRA
jgi:hypothetical protein